VPCTFAFISIPTIAVFPEITTVALFTSGNFATLLAIFAALVLCGTGLFTGVGVVGVGVVGVLDGAGVVIPGEGAGVVLGVVGVYLVGDGFLVVLHPVKDIDKAIIKVKSINKMFLVFFNLNTSNQYFAHIKTIYYNVIC
jgi:hypothetical protein